MSIKTPGKTFIALSFRCRAQRMEGAGTWTVWKNTPRHSGYGGLMMSDTLYPQSSTVRVCQGPIVEALGATHLRQGLLLEFLLHIADHNLDSVDVRHLMPSWLHR